MSLIYSALSRLEKKSSVSSTSSKPHLSAEYYSLSMQNRGMPLWIKVMLILLGLGIVLGFILAKTLPQFSAEKSTVTENRPELAQLASKPTTAVEVVAAPASAPVAIPVTEMISSPQFAELKNEDSRVVLADRAATRDEAHALPASPKETNASQFAVTDSPVNRELTGAKSNEHATQNEPAKTELSQPKARPDLVSKIEFKVENKLENKLENKFENKTNNKFDNKLDNKVAALEKNSLSTQSKSKNMDLATSKKQNNGAAANAAMAGLTQEEIQGMVKSFKSLIQAGKRAEANEILEVMKKNLAPESLTLLNLRAWGELKMGDQTVALTLYQQIVERSPDDESAAINLAVLYWKKGMQAEAKKTIEAISEVYPNSNVVQQYSRQFGVQR